MIKESSEAENPDRVSILEAFSQAANRSIEDALAGFHNPSDTHTPQDRLAHLLLLEKQFHQILGDRIIEARHEWRDQKIAQSPLLSQSPEVWSRIAHYLDETDLYRLERVSESVYATCAVAQRPCWDRQWQYLDQIRHSKSSIQDDDPRVRGLQFAQASLVAQQWERRRQPEDQAVYYNRHDFVEDFGYFFQDPTQAGDPHVEFFLRLSYESDNNSRLLLEGFQSNFISLRHTRDAQDTGYHTYIGAGDMDRLQIVMVRNDLHLLKPS